MYIYIIYQFIKQTDSLNDTSEISHPASDWTLATISHEGVKFHVSKRKIFQSAFIAQ